jgi:DNA-binding Lrp family transcriptional regulator
MEKGIIKKYVSFMDFSSFGYKMHANIYVSSREPEKVMEFISGHGSVNSVFKLKGSYDLMIDGFFPDKKSLDRFNSSLKDNGAYEAVSHEVLDEIKHEGLRLDEDERIDYPKHLFLL